MAVFASLLRAALSASLLCLPMVLFKLGGFPSEVSLFWGVGAFLVAGFFAGRSGTFPIAALATAFLGGLIAYGVFFALVAPPVDAGFAVIHALIAAAGGWAASQGRMVRVKDMVQIENEDKFRCKACGVRVGPRAKKCWSCRASLSRLI